MGLLGTPLCSTCMANIKVKGCASGCAEYIDKWYATWTPAPPPRPPGVPDIMSRAELAEVVAKHGPVLSITEELLASIYAANGGPPAKGRAANAK